MVTRVVADALECERVSLRLRGAANQAWTVAYHEGAERADDEWRAEDAERFAKLEKKRAPYHLSLVDFSAKPAEEPRLTRTVLAVPFKLGDEVVAGVIAYDRGAQSAVEESTFSTHDEAVIEQGSPWRGPRRADSRAARPRDSRPTTR